MTERRSTEPENPADVVRLVDQLGNADIHWNGTFYGLMPTIVGDAARQLLKSDAVAIARLIDALDDGQRNLYGSFVLQFVFFTPTDSRARDIVKP